MPLAPVTRSRTSGHLREFGADPAGPRRPCGRPRSGPWQSHCPLPASFAGTTMAAPDSTPNSRRRPLEDPDLRVVADHEAVGARLAALVAADGHVAAEQARLHAPGQVADLRAGEQDRVLDLGLLDHAVLADRRVRADVGVDQLRVG